MASAVSVLAPTVSHSQSLPTQEVLQYLHLSLWICCGPCGGSSDSDLALPLHVLTPKVHSCPQSPQPQLWKHSLSIQILHRCRVYQANCGDLICCSCSCMERFAFLFFGRTAPGFQVCFWPCLCMCATLRCLLSAQARGGKSSC